LPLLKRRRRKSKEEGKDAIFAVFSFKEV